MVVCTLCSCYPWEVLGLPPVWYKSAPYRSRAVIDPRGVLADFGVTLPAETEIRVWDSTAETRFLVLPMRPAGTEGWSEEQLAELVTRDCMIGTGLPKTAGRRPRDERRPRHGRHARLRPGRAGAERAGVPRAVGGPRAGDERAMGSTGALEHRHVARRARTCRRTSISRAPTTSAGCWAGADPARQAGWSSADEIAAGHALRPAKPVQRTMLGAETSAPR